MTTTHTRIPRTLLQALVLLVLMPCAPISQASDASSALSFQLGYNDNAGLAPDNGDVVSSSLLELLASRRYQTQLDTSSSLSYAAHFGIRRYTDIAYHRASLGMSVGYQKKWGLGFDKPRISISLDGKREIYDRSNLDAYVSNLSVVLSKPWTPQIDTSVRFNARREILDETSSEVVTQTQIPAEPILLSNLTSFSISVSAEYFASERWSFPATVEFLDGEIGSVSSAAFSEGTGVIERNAINPRNLVRAIVDGQALSAKIAASLLLENNSRLNLELGYVKAESRQDIGYDRQQISVTWAKDW